MKSNRFELFIWFTCRSKDTIEIPWPAVHHEVGLEKIQWLNKQPKSKCQLVVDKLNNKLKLVAEFYDEQTLTAYHLMWAK